MTIVPVASFLALFPTTLLLGVAFPIGLRLWTGDNGETVEHAGERIGVFYSVNTFGAILGSLAAGFLLLPWLGSRLSVICLGTLSLASGLLLLTTFWPSSRVLIKGGAGVSLFLVAALTLPDPFMVARDFRQRGEQILWREEGLQGTVAVHQRPNGNRALYLDGLSHANDGSENVLIHRLIGHLPMMLHPDPSRVLVVGLGAGTTADAISQHANAQVDLVELSASMVRGSEWLRHVNNDVLRQPNVHLRVDDGRNFLLLTPNRYDVIASDTIPPHHAGAGNLFSVEYFQLARRALNDDGLISQWLEVESEAQRVLLVRTFLHVFPDATLWKKQLLIGAKRPLPIDRDALKQRWDSATMREVLGSMGMSDPTGGNLRRCGKGAGRWRQRRRTLPVSDPLRQGERKGTP